MSMNKKNEDILRRAAERTGQSYEQILEEFQKLSHDHKREVLHQLKIELRKKVPEKVYIAPPRWFPVK